MNRIFKTVAVSVMSTLTLAGCGSSAYHPPASDTELASYAGKSSYPNVQAVQAPHLFAVVAPDSSITIYNAGDESYTDFEVWVNKAYTLHVIGKQLDSRDKLLIAPNSLFNGTGATMGGGAIPANGISTIQLYNKEQLLTVQGPILPH